MDVARLNFAHGSPEQHAETVELIDRSRRRPAGRSPSSRTSRAEAAARVDPGRRRPALGRRDVTLVPGRRTEDVGNGRLPVAVGFAELVEPDQVVYLADGAVRLRVRDVAGEEVRCAVEVGGTLASRQGINLPNVTVSLPAVSGEDLG